MDVTDANHPVAEGWAWAAHDAAMSEVVMRTMPNIVREWGLTQDDMAALLGMEVEMYRKWSVDPSEAHLKPRQLERTSYLLGIYKALVILLPLPKQQRHWLHHPNQGALYQGTPPIARMRQGLEGLQAVRRHLDAERQGGFA